MRFVADTLRIRSGGRDKEIQRLHTGIARALRHNIKKLSVGLRMKLVEHNTVYIKAVFRVSLG